MGGGPDGTSGIARPGRSPERYRSGVPWSGEGRAGGVAPDPPPPRGSEARRPRLAFLSLLDGEPWGGSEHLWFAAACRAAEEGHPVAASVRAWPGTEHRAAPLVDAGGELFLRVHAEADGPDPEPGPRPSAPPFDRPVRRLADRVADRRRPPMPGVDGRLLAFRPDLLVVNQGAHYDLGRPEVVALLSELDCPYVVITHAVDDRHDPRPAARARLRQAYAGAAARGFSNTQVAEAAERQLAASVAPWFGFSNPLPDLPPLPLPWPDHGSGSASLAFVGRLSIAKGLDLLLDVLARPPWPDRDLCLHLYGELRQHEYVHDLIAHFGLRDRVVVEGVADDIGGIWTRHELLVLPSRSEGAPLAVAEAMACGRPVVATAVGGLRDWVVDGETGYLARGTDRHELAAALERAWAARDRWPELGCRAHARITDRLGPDPAGALLERLRAVAQRASG